MSEFRYVPLLATLSLCTICTSAVDLAPPGGSAGEAAFSTARVQDEQDDAPSKEDPNPPFSLTELVQAQANTLADPAEAREAGEEAEGPVRTIVDLVVARDGNVRWMMVNSADLLDRDGRVSLVPTRFLTVERVDEEPELTIELGVRELGVLPGFDLDALAEPGALDRIVRAIERTGERAPERDPSATVAEEAPLTAPHYLLATELLELPVHAKDEGCGQVEDGVFDPVSRRVGHVFVDGCVGGAGDGSVVVPTAVTTWGVRDEEVVLLLPKTRDELSEAVLVTRSGDDFPDREALARADRFFEVEPREEGSEADGR